MSTARLFLIPAFLIGFLSPLFASEEKGAWYGSFATDIGGIEISIDLDQLSAGRSGTASISFLQIAPELNCPPVAHPDLCSELKSRAKRTPNGAFFAEEEGVLYEGDDEAFVAFRFRDEVQARLLAIQRSKQNPNGASIRFYHHERGVDAHVDAKRGRHFCETAQCSEQIRNALESDPAKALGL
ncbi:MAG: hypothetical protein AAGF25_11915, partial [Pseudomonadota bacterium]